MRRGENCGSLRKRDVVSASTFINNFFFFFSRAKHPVKVHVRAAISIRGPSGIAIFDGIMDAAIYVSILDNALLPFLRSVYSDGHRSMQDNDPKHTSRMANSFMLDNNISW